MQLAPALVDLLLLLRQLQASQLHCVGAAVVSGQGSGPLGQAAGHCNTAAAAVAVDDAAVDAGGADAGEDDTVAESVLVAAGGAAAG